MTAMKFLSRSAASALLLIGSMVFGANYQMLQKPNILMNTHEFENLRDQDRIQYVASIREILKHAPDIFLLSEENQCGRSFKQCEPSIFGTDNCIPLNASAASACREAKKTIKDPFTNFLWEGYANRIQDICTEQKMPKICRDLEEKRVQTFMSRRTH